MLLSTGSDIKVTEDDQSWQGLFSSMSGKERELESLRLFNRDVFLWHHGYFETSRKHCCLLSNALFIVPSDVTSCKVVTSQYIEFYSPPNCW